MSEPTTQPVADDLVARATDLLRQHTDRGWVAVEASVLQRARRAVRPSTPVLGHHGLGDFFVSAQLLQARVRELVDAVPLSAATSIACTTGDGHRLGRVTVELVVAYGAVLVDVAVAVHAAVLVGVRQVLGPVDPDSVRVETHVHVGDVADDPRDVE